MSVKSKFSYIILISGILHGGLIYMIYRFGFVTAANEVYARFISLGVFIVSFAILGWHKVKYYKFSWNDLYKKNTLIVISLTVMLCSLFLRQKVSFYTINLFVAVSFIHFLYTRKFYVPPKYIYFLFAYALLLFLGTTSTQRGFHFPDYSLNFFVLSLTFCLFNLSKKNLLRTGEMFFKTEIIFLTLCLLYWWFNFLHLNVNFMDWITVKTGYSANMYGWLEQAKTMLGYEYQDIVELKNINYFSAYFFVNSWSYVYHPTAISIVLLSGLITGFYLYFNKNELLTVSLLDLLLYIALCLLIILLMQSRLGIIGFFLIVGISGMYYLKKKIKYFKIALAICILLIGLSFVVFNKKISNVVNDDIRASYREIAVSYIKEHFWWGIGFNQQRIALEWQAEKMKDRLPKTVYPHNNQHITHTHNQFLGNMVQFGILGLIVLIAMLVVIAHYAIKNRSYPLLTFLIFMLAFMMIEEGEYIKFIIFIMFFTAISNENNRQIIDLRKCKK